MDAAARRRSFADVCAEALAGALAFVLPVECAGCGEPDVALCDDCRTAFAPRPVEQRLDGLRVVSALRFDGPVARAVRALKEDGRTSLARDFAPALRTVAARFDLAGVAVIAVPTSAAALRRRGYRVAELLARRAVLPVDRGLRPARRTADQRGLDRDARARNVAGSMVARAAAGRRILIVDDVVTTGATLHEAARALREGGADVIGAVTLAATVRRDRPDANSPQAPRDTPGVHDYGGGHKRRTVRP